MSVSQRRQYVPVRLDDVLVKRLAFISAFENSDRSKTIRGLLTEAADRRMRELAAAETAAPSPSPAA